MGLWPQIGALLIAIFLSRHTENASVLESQRSHAAHERANKLYEERGTARGNPANRSNPIALAAQPWPVNVPGRMMLGIIKPTEFNVWILPVTVGLGVQHAQ